MSRILEAMAQSVLGLVLLALLAGCGSRTALDGSSDPGDGGTPPIPGIEPVPQLSPLAPVYFDSDDTNVRLLQIVVAAAPDDGVFVAGGNAVAVTVLGRRLDAGAFLTAFDRSGTLRWVAPIVSRNGGSRISAAVGAPDGSVIVGGYLADEVDFGGVSKMPQDEDGDGFVARYDSTGALSWVRVLGSSSTDRVDTVELAGGDHIYVGGYVGAPIDFGSGSLAVSDHDAFLLELSPNGDPIRVEHLPCDGRFASVLGLARAANGDVLLAGYATNRIHVDGQPVGDGSGAFEGFWARLDAGFARRQAAALPLKIARSVEGNAAGGAFVAGELERSASIAGVALDPEPQGGPLIVTLDEGGNAVGARLVASGGRIYDLALDRRQNLYGVGSISSTPGQDQPYLVRYSSAGEPALVVWDEARAALTSLAVTPGGHLWASGYFESTLSFGGAPHDVPAPSGFLLHFPPE